VIYLPVLSGQQTYFVSDHTFFFEPFSKFIGERLRQGQLPLWNPYLYCGMSQVAVPSPGIFYPATWSYAFFPYSQALGWQMVMHQGLAGCFMFLLISSFGWSFAPCAVAALTFALTGYMFALSTNFTLAATSSCLPLIIWSFRSVGIARALNRQSLMYGFIALSSLGTYLLIAAGRPEIFAPGISLLVAFVVLDGINNHQRDISWSVVIQGWLYQMLAFGTGILLTMPVLLPLAEWARLSPRAVGLTVSHALMWSCNWYDWVGLILVQPFGDLQILGAPLLKLICTRQTFLPYITSEYIGPIAFTLSVWGFSDKRWSWRMPVAAMILMFVFMCLGEFTPFAPFLITHFPKFSILRYPVKWLIFIIFCLAISGARGLLAAEEEALPANIVVWTGGIWTITFILALVFCFMSFKNILLGVAPYALPPSAMMPVGKAMIAASVIGAAFCFFICVSKKKEWPQRNVVAMAVLSLACNLLVVAWQTRQMTETSEFFKTPTLMSNWLDKHSSGKPGRLLLTYFDPVHVPSDYRYKPGASWTASFYQYCRQSALCNTNIDTKTKNVFGYEAGETNSYRTMFLDTLHATKIEDAHKPESADLPLWNLCKSTSTEFVGSQIAKKGIARRILTPKYFAVVEENQTMNLRLYRVVDSSKRVFFAKSWQWVDNQQEIANRLTSEKANDFEPIMRPLIERRGAIGNQGDSQLYAPVIAQAPESVAVSNGKGAPLVVPEEKKVTLLTDEPEHVSIAVASEVPGFVVLNDHFYPGWQASIDSVAAKTYRANTEMRAVYMPAGRHLLEFDFKPESLYLGFKFAAAGLALMLCFLATAAFPSFWRFTKSLAGQ
jgi:hypothetical protein